MSVIFTLYTMRILALILCFLSLMAFSEECPGILQNFAKILVDQGKLESGINIYDF